MPKEEKDKTREKVSAAKALESLLMIQSAAQERMLKINEQLQELEKDPKMRGGKKYNSLIRSFCMLSKKYTDNLEVENELRELEEEESAIQNDITSLMEGAKEYEERQDRRLKEENPKLWQQKHETEEALEKWERERSERLAREAVQEAYRRMGQEPPKQSAAGKDHEEVQKKMLMTIKDAKEVKR